MSEFNIIGKVDASKVLISPDVFHLKLKEAIEINSVDYEKFKKTILEKPAIQPSKEWIEKQRDQQFQNVFKELWPNVYSRIEEAEKPKPSANEILADLAKKRIMYEEKLNNDLKYIKYSNANAGCNCSKTNSCNCLKVCELINHNHESFFKKKEPFKPVDSKPYPNVMSSYDFPWTTSKHNETLVKSSYNPDELTQEAKLLKSIQESQEKLKASQKMEKTTDLIDDMINKFKTLQDEMKKKSEALKLKSEYEDLKTEIRKARSRSLEKKISFKLSDDEDDLSDVSLEKCPCHHHYNVASSHCSAYSSLNSRLSSAKLNRNAIFKNCKSVKFDKDYNIY